ncbi:hypothetical protein [Pelagicoccus sp. SDUM812005]|uniref:hypothetical protein n=1 Tax=Pelagicoccus sp. SDUM812005 TaxID=3041257 RepID=UPI00280D8C15|nr:hypothetical protein [Pelagicoccus sp. SDUM812005]MDQ8181576.1 hypothetical protein [Pelagicoccus sp. SDUM812005]
MAFVPEAFDAIGIEDYLRRDDADTEFGASGAIGPNVYKAILDLSRILFGYGIAHRDHLFARDALVGSEVDHLRQGF